MGRFRTLKNSFLGGQVSRDAVGRTDLPQYAHASEVVKNFIPLLSGGMYRRPGSIYQDYLPCTGATADPAGDTYQYQSSPPRFFPFIVSNQEAYAVLIGTMRWSATQLAADPNAVSGGGYMKYYRASGNTNTAVTGTLSAGAFPYRCKSLQAASTLTGQYAYTRQGGPGAVKNTGRKIDTTTIIDVADSLQSYEDDIWAVQFCQGNDVMFLTHPDYPPQAIYLSAANTLTGIQYDYGLPALNTLSFCQTRPYLNQNSTAVTMTVSWSGVTNTVGTLTASASFFDTLHGPTNVFAGGAPHTGAIFALAVGTGANMTGNNTDNGILFCEVTSVTSATVCQVSFVNGVPSNYSKGTATTAWWESAWSNYRGWPRACGIFQQRLCFASTKHQPSTLWFTGTDAYGVSTTGAAGSNFCKFSSLGDGPNQGITSGVTGTLANGRAYTTPRNWYYAPVDDSQGDGQSTGPLGSQPFRISLATTSLDFIQYLSPDQQLFIGTATQEWICAAQNGSFDVANSDCTIQSHYGSDLVQAIRIGYEMIFVHQKKDEVRAYQYNYFDQSFFGEPVQLFFDEFPEDEEGEVAADVGLGEPAVLNGYAGRKKFRQIDWDASRSTLWSVDTAGNLFGLTRDRKLAVTAWHTHEFGGFNDLAGIGQNIRDNLTTANSYTDSANFLCDGSIISACTLPNPLSGIRDVWTVVKRSMGGNNIWSIERMVGGNTVRQSAYSPVAPGNAQEPLYVDCAKFLADIDPAVYTYNVGAQLAGATLVGTYYSETWGMFAISCTDVVQTDGSVTLQSNLPPDYGDSSARHTIVLGLGYSSILQPVRVDPPSPIGTSQGAMKRISKAYIRLFKTLMLKVGSPPQGSQSAQLELVDFDPPPSMGQSPEIYTGDKEVSLPNDFDRSGYLYIVQDQPLPCTVVSVVAEGMEYEQ